ncbi:MAG: hypothetical protein WCJ58_01325 [bacterium]
MEISKLENLLTETQPRVSEEQQRLLKIKLLKSYRPIYRSGRFFYNQIWFKFLIISLIIILLSSPLTLKMTQAISNCGFDSDCIVNSWYQVNDAGNPSKFHLYRDGGWMYSGVAIEKDKCLEIMNEAGTVKIEETAVRISFRFPSGNITDCLLVPKASKWMYEEDNLSYSERVLLQRLNLGMNYTTFAGDTADNYQYYYAREPKVKLTNQEIESKLASFGAKFIETFDGNDYYTYPDYDANHLKISWSRDWQYLELVHVYQERESDNNAEDTTRNGELFKNLIAFIEKGQ